MKYLRILLCLGLVPGCAAMEDFHAGECCQEQEYLVQPAGSCSMPASGPQPPQVTPSFSPAPIQPTGYQTKEPPM